MVTSYHSSGYRRVREGAGRRSKALNLERLRQRSASYVFQLSGAVAISLHLRLLRTTALPISFARRLPRCAQRSAQWRTFPPRTLLAPSSAPRSATRACAEGTAA